MLSVSDTGSSAYTVPTIRDSRDGARGASSPPPYIRGRTMLSPDGPVEPPRASQHHRRVSSPRRQGGRAGRSSGYATLAVPPRHGPARMVRASRGRCPRTCHLPPPLAPARARVLGIGRGGHTPSPCVFPPGFDPAVEERSEGPPPSGSNLGMRAASRARVTGRRAGEAHRLSVWGWVQTPTRQSLGPNRRRSSTGTCPCRSGGGGALTAIR